MFPENEYDDKDRGSGLPHSGGRGAAEHLEHSTVEFFETLFAVAYKRIGCSDLIDRIHTADVFQGL